MISIPNPVRKTIVICLLTSLGISITLLFWYNEWIYSLPTPVPKGYTTVAVGGQIDLPAGLGNRSKPVFLHFFNPDCPCSRFNIPHFKSLVNDFGSDVDFVIVPVTSKPITPEDIRKRFDLNISVVIEPALAKLLGVYSTPQAAIVDTNHRLYFRGNYNRSRYCVDKKTEYARLAIQALMLHENPLEFDQFALKAYGCQTPKCTLQ